MTNSSPPLAPRPPSDWLGYHTLYDNIGFVGAAPPFGRLHARDLRALTQAAHHAGAAVLRISPWRAILIPSVTASAAPALLAAIDRLEFITDAMDPRLAVAACPGAPACSSAFAETRAMATSLAPLVASTGDARTKLHVSGCAKGCAHPRAAPFTVVATNSGYDLIRNGRADAAPFARGLDAAALRDALAAGVLSP